MMNIEQITSRLAQMPDQTLQQYAMMHKDDPYIMALAVSESRRRKQMRQAAQGMQGQMPQHKVVDRMLAEMGDVQNASPEQMARLSQLLEAKKQAEYEEFTGGRQAQPALQQLPEDMGIAHLPTQEMDFAGGGIVAFADGGDVERYNGTTGSLTGGSIFAQLDQEKANRLAQLDAQLAQINPMLIAASQSGDRQAIQQYSQQAQAIRDQINAVRESAGNRMAGIEQLMGTAPAAKETPTAPAMPAGQFNRMPGTEQLNLPVAPPADVSAAAPAAVPTGGISQAALDQGRAPMPGPQLDRGRMGARRSSDEIAAEKAGLGATPEAAAMRRDTATAPKTSTVQGAKDLAGQFYDTEGEKKAIKDYVAGRKEAIEKARQRYAEGKPEGKAYSKFEEMLQAEEGRAGKEKDEATGVAIFKAGLAMMSGTSPRAFENIGKGALTGLEEYSSAMKDMKKAAKERQKAFAEIENARRAEERDDWKAKNAAEDKRDEHLDNAERYGVEGISKVTGKGAELSKDIYKLGVEQEGLDRRARQILAQRSFDLQGEYAKALLAGDKPRAASLLEAIQATSAAKRPGLDLTLLKTFENLPGVGDDLKTLNSLKSVPNPKQATLKQIAEIEQRLLQKARANNIDPQQVGLGATSTTGGGQRTIDFNAIP